MEPKREVFICVGPGLTTHLNMYGSRNDTEGITTANIRLSGQSFRCPSTSQLSSEAMGNSLWIIAFQWVSVKVTVGQSAVWAGDSAILTKKNQQQKNINRVYLPVWPYGAHRHHLLWDPQTNFRSCLDLRIFQSVGFVSASKISNYLSTIYKLRWEKKESSHNTAMMAKVLSRSSALLS